MAEIDLDAIHWTYDVNGDLMPLIPSKEFNYPPESDVRVAIVYGYDDQYEGTFDAGDIPQRPTLTVEDLGGGSVLFTFSGSSATSSNKIFVRVASATSWDALPLLTIAGDGSATATLDSGPYLAKVHSQLGTAISPAENEPVLFHVQNASATPVRSDFGDEFRDCCVPEFLEAFGEEITYQRGIQAVTLQGIAGDVLNQNDPTTGLDIAIGEASWEVVVDQLDFGSGPIVPRAQDQIITSNGEVFCVVEAGVLDSERMMWTIPVKRSEFKELP